MFKKIDIGYFNNGDAMKLLLICLRTIFFYFFITLSYRIMGKREIGKLGIIDLIVSILIAELVAISIENYQESLFMTVIPILTLIGLEILLAYISLKNNNTKRIIDGKPSLIIKNGLLNYKEMLKQRYSLDDLLLALRQNSIKTIEDVEYAVLEPNGKLSIFKYDLIKQKGSYPLPIIIDGILDKESLDNINKDYHWLNHAMITNNLKISDIFYAFYKNDKIYFIKKSS